MRDDMLRLIDGSKLPADAVLGVITIFTVPDKSVNGAKLLAEWAREGLDPKHMPDVRKPVDDFRQACRRVETRKHGSSNGTRRTEVKVDEVTNQGDLCVYQITRMVRDQAQRVIDHPKAMTLEFDKNVALSYPDATDCIKVIPQDPTTFGALKGLADDITNWYDGHRSEVPGQKVRNAVREVMVEMGGENLRRASGGVYFVPTAGADTLTSLARICDNLYGADADFSFFPQPSTKAAAKMVAKHHVMNVQIEADEMISKISERLKSNTKVRKDLLTNLVQRRRELGAHRKLYIEILGTEQKLITEKLSMVDDSLEALMAQAV